MKENIINTVEVIFRIIVLMCFALQYSQTSLNRTPLIRKIRDPDIKFKERIFNA